MFEFDATDDATSDHFVLDGGPARLTYVVTAESTTDGIRTADIYFQDLAAHTESSYVDTTIYVDKPGSGIADLGQREGTFFIMTGVRPLNVAGVTIHISVEQMRPVSD